MKYIKNKKTMPHRMIPFLAVVILTSIIASITLVSYQIVDGTNYEIQAKQSNTTKIPVTAARGQITDRYGRILVSNKLSLNIAINSEFPQPVAGDDEIKSIEKNKEGNKIILNLVNFFNTSGASYEDNFPIDLNNNTFKKGKEQEIEKLKKGLLAQEYATAHNCIELLAEKYNIDGYDQRSMGMIAAIRGQMLIKEYTPTIPYVFAKEVDSNFASRVMEVSSQMKGVEVLETSQRTYPSGDIAPHIIGLVGPIYSEHYKLYKEKGYPMDAVVGKSGIESSFEDQLRGIDGKQTIVRSKDGEVLDKYFSETDKPSPGNSVVLSIDSKLQKQLQDALGAYVKSTGGKGAGLSVLDVKTGETLALISYPGYDINEYSTKYQQLEANSLNPLTNRAINGLYRPGSTFKTFMSASGMLNGTFTTSTYYNCSNPFPGTDMACVQDHHRGPTNIYTALQRSCNNFFYNVAKNMGIDKIDEYAPSFGFATDTGLEITNSDGRVTNPSFYEEHSVSYVPGFTYQTGIGQAEVMVSPLQMAVSMMTIANHGTRYAAHLIKTIDKYDHSENVSTTIPKVLSSLPDQNKAFDVTIQGMKLMAQTRPALSGLDIAVKSGSPQYDDKNRNKTNAAGVGIYPASNPQIAFGLIIEDGKSAQDFFATVIKIYEACKVEQVENMWQTGGLIIK